MPEKQSIEVNKLSNGLTLVVEQIPNVESVAFELELPGGVLLDSQQTVGGSLLLAELTSRGAGSYSSRELSDAFEAKGIRHAEGAGLDRFSYRGLLLSENLAEALRLLSLMILEPRLPEDDIESIKSMLLQDIAALLDNPAKRCLLELAKRYYPPPYERSTLGDEQGIKRCDINQQRSEWKRLYSPKGAVLSVAGNCSMLEVGQLAERYFGKWVGEKITLPLFGSMPSVSHHHVPEKSSQLQIGMAWPSSPYGHELQYAAKVANGVLSGGMFGRLFTEVREKRGLVYSVYSRQTSTRNYGTCMAYAGTTPERARETLDVMLQVMRSVKGSVGDEELRRVKANLKAGLVIGEESSSSRASSNANDWWHGQRVRTMDEMLRGIDQVDQNMLDHYFDAFPLDSFSLLSLGSVSLN